jgi:hypothetical protein
VTDKFYFLRGQPILAITPCLSIGKNCRELENYSSKPWLANC